ncbi:MAG TPA: enoyl-CoA hydratase/isomerase family protein [Solimonas sp.]|nr:enoyl-CoA hydratase/isomerase family protein [Solimonas sp.]
MTRQIHIERRGRILLATLDNPPHALMSATMVAELGALVDQAEGDEGIGAVVLTGAHPERFIAHYDVAELLQLGRSAPAISEAIAKFGISALSALEKVPGSGSLLDRTPAAGLAQLRGFHDTLSRIGRSGAVFIAAINGIALGGGCELALSCDLRLISDDGQLGQPELLLGIPPGGGGTQRLARLIGRGRALELVLEGRPVPADEAERIGLVHRVLPRGQLLDEALATADRLSRRSKAVVAATKRAVLEGGSLPLEMGLKMEQAAFVMALGLKPTQRAMQAYVDELQRSGRLPAADPQIQQRLLDGRFVDFG